MFVCFEGIDGAGKSTQARMLLDRLSAAGQAVELVADPGTTPLGSAIRQILLQSDTPIAPVAQMLLFSAGRAELAAHIRQKISDGVIILCDRWLLSTLVYQGEINGVDPALIMSVFQGSSNLIPDLCFLLDLEPESASARIGAPRDRYERKSLEDRQRMRAAYLRFSAQPETAHRLCKLNALLSPEELHDEVWRVFNNVTRSSR